jgi:hypothetical protein
MASLGDFESILVNYLPCFPGGKKCSKCLGISRISFRQRIPLHGLSQQSAVMAWNAVAPYWTTMGIRLIFLHIFISLKVNLGLGRGGMELAANCREQPQ